MGSNVERLPSDAAGLRLCRIDRKDELHLCEPILFTRRRAAVQTVLLRAAISGTVEVEPEGSLGDYFADVLDERGYMVGNVNLDAKSYRALKTKWMRCKVEPRP